MGACQSCLDRVGKSIEPKIKPKSVRKQDNSLLNLTDLNALKVIGVDEFYNRNTADHYTQLYEFDEFGKQRSNRLLSRLTSSNSEPKRRPLILRRGQSFDLKITFNREFRKGDDLINLVFSLNDATNPNYSDKTQIVVPLNDENMNTMTNYNDLNSWFAHITKIEDTSIIVEVTSSVNCLIGEYRLSVDIKTRNGFNSFALNTKIFMLFNSWNKKDTVYLRSREGRNEWILNENAIIFRGTWNSIRPTNWGLCQFSEDVLECTMYLLEYVGSIPISERNSPIKIARHLTEIIHDANGYGLLKGNWNENFSDGKAPSSWLNSKEILSQYLKTKRTVKYAQCWNFAGTLCSCLRALGIASRIVTCYMAAHDTQGSLTVDRVFNENLEHLKDKSADSVWNFHTFVEIWCKRPDLDPSGKFDGWNVVDSTPQELSDRLYRCGPASVQAVKAGLIQTMYDTNFVYAEVNSDEVFWLYKDSNTPLKLIQTNTEEIGKLIITKSIGSNDYDDITSNYKEREGSKQERETMLRALKSSSSDFARFYLNEQFKDVLFELKILDNAIVGKDFKVRLTIANKSDNIYSVEAVFAIRSTNYTNKVQQLVKRVTQEKKISPSTEDEMIVPVTYTEYSDYLMGDNTFNISVLANVKESLFNYISMIDFRFRMPDIKIDIEGDVIRGRPFYVRAYFTNPLSTKLTNGGFMIDGPGLDKTLFIKLNRPIFANEEASCNFVLTPKTIGEKVISVKFSCNQLKDVDGFKNIKVSPNLNDVALHDEDFY